MERQRVIRGALCAMGGSLCWVLSGACAQFLFDNYGVGELWITCVRMLLAGVLFMASSLVFDRRGLFGIPRDGRAMVQTIAFALFGVLFCQVSYMFTISITNAGTASVIQSLGVALVMLYGCVRMRKLPAMREVAALALALGGIFLICTNGNPFVLVLPPEGIAWGGITAISLALYTLLPGSLIAKWGSFAVTGYSMLVGGVVLVPFVRPWESAPVFDGAGWAAFVAVVIVGTIIAYVLYLQGIAEAGPLLTGMFGSAIEPVGATILSAVWLGVQFTPATLVGFAMIVVMGLLLTAKKPEKESDAVAKE